MGSRINLSGRNRNGSYPNFLYYLNFIIVNFCKLSIVFSQNINKKGLRVYGNNYVN